MPGFGSAWQHVVGRLFKRKPSAPSGDAELLNIPELLERSWSGRGYRREAGAAEDSGRHWRGQALEAEGARRLSAAAATPRRRSGVRRSSSTSQLVAGSAQREPARQQDSAGSLHQDSSPETAPASQSGSSSLARSAGGSRPPRQRASQGKVSLLSHLLRLGPRLEDQQRRASMDAAHAPAAGSPAAPAQRRLAGILRRSSSEPGDLQAAAAAAEPKNTSLLSQQLTRAQASLDLEASTSSHACPMPAPSGPATAPKPDGSWTERLVTYSDSAREDRLPKGYGLSDVPEDGVLRGDADWATTTAQEEPPPTGGDAGAAGEAGGKQQGGSARGAFGSQRRTEWDRSFIRRWRRVQREARLQALGVRTLWMASSPSDARAAVDLLVDDVGLVEGQSAGGRGMVTTPGCMSRDVSFSALLEGEVV